MGERIRQFDWARHPLGPPEGWPEALRMALSPAPTPLQITFGFVLTLATTALFVWAGGRIFRVGILMQGKSASFSEMIRWVRAG